VPRTVGAAAVLVNVVEALDGELIVAFVPDTNVHAYVKEPTPPVTEQVQDEVATATSPPETLVVFVPVTGLGESLAENARVALGTIRNVCNIPVMSILLR